MPLSQCLCCIMASIVFGYDCKHPLFNIVGVKALYMLYIFICIIKNLIIGRCRHPNYKNNQSKH